MPEALHITRSRGITRWLVATAVGCHNYEAMTIFMFAIVLAGCGTLGPLFGGTSRWLLEADKAYLVTDNPYGSAITVSRSYETGGRVYSCPTVESPDFVILGVTGTKYTLGTCEVTFWIRNKSTEVLEVLTRDCIATSRAVSNNQPPRVLPIRLVYAKDNTGNTEYVSTESPCYEENWKKLQGDTFVIPPGGERSITFADIQGFPSISKLVLQITIRSDSYGKIDCGSFSFVKSRK